MAHTFSLLILAFAVSLDSFSVGLTYGLRKMSIPFKSISIIACCSALILMAAMTIGHFIEAFLSPALAESLGGVILIFLGAWVLYQFFRPEKVKDVLPHEKTIVNLEIKSLGLVINILKKPMSADFDKSGTITGIEALMLGLALSLDAFGAGIGAAMLGYSPFYLAMTVAVMSSLFVFMGMQVGSLFSKSGWVHKFSFIPGIILIVIGILKI
ncbi:putative sporulation protein YtaF [Cytobacillus firmus]|uniref:Putative sporulation protein YtaF n=2 Tax=Cytobacillus TaxID=2675230 RepID=A0A366JY46_CYTFI|nr:MULTISPECIES: sporulation membrane protein YtaF [Cytobacillus]RBP93897.1 putative sporulation protein YtaF [Cytobacillus firmus]TDX47689.1 putative sporulation protein YtaF [Cytobacillus oceanisediminis]